MKKLFSLMVTTIMATALMATVASAATTATPTASNVLVNGVSKSFDAYNIEGSNYFKLRDLAYVLNGTQKQFEVTFDSSKNAINMLSGTAYTVASGEMSRGDGKAKPATITNSAIYVDGTKVNLSAYNIGGSNYFKLRDMMQTFDVAVGWDGGANTITLNSAGSYATTPTTPTQPTQPTAPATTIELPIAIYNATGVIIYELYLSPTNTADWGNDLLGDGVLLDSDTGVYTLVIDADTLKWDVMIKDSEGNSIELYGLDISEANIDGAVVLLEYDADTQVGSATLYTD